MKILLKLSFCALLTTVASSCGVLEQSVPSPNLPSASVPVAPPLLTSGGTVTTASTRPLSGAGSDSANVAERTGQAGGGSNTAVNRELVTRIFQTDRCNQLSVGGFVWFTDTVVLDDWLSSLAPDVTRKVKSQVDFDRQGVLLVDYGVAGTGGSAATVVGDGLEIKGNEAFIKIKRFQSSSTDKKRAQVVTHPCSLHVMPRVGFSSLIVQNELGDKLTSFSNK